MDINEYGRIVAEWRVKYNVKVVPETNNLTSIVVACKRCGGITPRMHRHHMRNDFFFAQLLPDIYAARYCEFHKDDVERLCDTCHQNIHKYWKPLVQRMWRDYPGPGKVEESWCERWRCEFFEWYIMWQRTTYRKPNKHRGRAF